MPELDGKLDGKAIRVPTPNVSCVDLVVPLNKDVTVESINQAMKEAAEGALQGILAYTEEPIVSTDLMTRPESSIFDAALTKVIGPRMAKIITWYDNEWGYSQRMVDVLKYIAAQG